MKNRTDVKTYPHIMDWDRFGKKGKRCEILGGNGPLVQVGFQDGTTEIISRRAIRRATESEKNASPGVNQNILAATHPTSAGERTMSLARRPYGPNSQAALVANQIPLNVQATQTQQAGGPLPVTFNLAATTETLIPSVPNATVPLTVAYQPNNDAEQVPFELWFSGMIQTRAAGTITIKVYEGTSATIGSNILLGSSGAITQNTTIESFWAHATLILNSVSGTLSGRIDFYINRTVVAAVTLSNFPSGLLTQGNPSANPPTITSLPSFVATVQSSGAGAGTLTTVNLQMASAG